MTDQVPTHPGQVPGTFGVTDDATADRHRLSLDKLKALRKAVQQRRAQLDADNFEVFLQRTPEVREEYATEALDEMFDWYEDYVAHRASIEHYLDALTVVEQWAADPTHAPAPLPDMELAGAEEEALTAPGTLRPFRPFRPARPLLVDRQVAFGAAVADTQQLRADLHREVAEVMPKVLANELDARLPILLNEQLRGIGAAGGFTPIGGKYTPDTPVQATPAIEEPLVPVGAKAALARDAAAARAEPHPPAPRRHRR